MILGAGPYQVPAIRKAAEMGYHVVSVDYLPHNVGHKYSHEYINCSTTDLEGILAAAIKLRIDAIATFCSDVAVAAVVYVASQLGIPGMSKKTLDVICRKDYFRDFQAKNKFNHPQFIFSDIFSGIRNRLENLRPPLIFKPVDSSGSRGVTWISDFNMEACLDAFRLARTFSRSQGVCVEEVLQGIEVGGDAFVLEGDFAFLTITHKYLRGFVPVGHSLPTNISPAQQAFVREEVAATCRALGYKNGPVNFDVIVSDKDATILDMGLRSGGNCIPSIIEHGTGVDLIRAAILNALGEKIHLEKGEGILQNCGAMILGSDRSGVLQRIPSIDEIQKVVPEIFEYIIDYEIGQTVQQFSHSGHRIGHVLFDMDGPDDYLIISGKIGEVLESRACIL